MPVINAIISGPTNNPPKQYQQFVILANRGFAEQVTQPNTKYIVKHDFDLGGQSITLPENCILEIDGGSISNGTLVGDNTVLVNSNKQNKSDILNVTISGTWGTPDVELNYDSVVIHNQGEQDDLSLLYYDRNKKCVVWYNGEKFVELQMV